jgi:hypothetical protein
VQVVRAETSCGLAYMICTYHATNSGVTVTGRNVLVLKKIDEEWLIVTHASIVRD